MKYIQTFKTIEEAEQFKKSILDQKLTQSQKFIIAIPSLKKIMSFNQTDWMLPVKPCVFEYEKESVSTKKIINILLKANAFPNKDKSDKNIYKEDIKNVLSFGKLFCGQLDKESLSIIKSKNIVNDFSCIEKFENLVNIDGVCQDGSAQNFFGIVDMIKIRLPKTLKSIGKSAFAFCVNLNDIEIPDSVNSIQSKAFFGCSMLETIEFGENVNELQSMCFGNSGIKKIIFKGEKVPTIMKTTFKNMKEDFIIEVPEHAYDEYINAWSMIADHIICK